MMTQHFWKYEVRIIFLEIWELKIDMDIQRVSHYRYVLKFTEQEILSQEQIAPSEDFWRSWQEIWPWRREGRPDNAGHIVRLIRVLSGVVLRCINWSSCKFFVNIEQLGSWFIRWLISLVCQSFTAGWWSDARPSFTTVWHFKIKG